MMNANRSAWKPLHQQARHKRPYKTNKRTANFPNVSMPLRKTPRCSTARKSLPLPTDRYGMSKFGLPTGASLALAPTSDLPSPWLVLGTFIGLPLALWTYKCFMMVLFQRKIIYMGYVPPDARTQELREVPTKLHVDEVRIPGEGHVTLYSVFMSRHADQTPQTVLLYLQGNAGNPLGRIPIFERLLIGPTFSSESSTSLDQTAVLAVAPRSYWKSTRRTPTERGIISDYKHALAYVVSRFPDANIVLYGHSLGGAAAVNLSAHVLSDEFPTVQGLVLENPFASIPEMVKALYPQRWLPYHYLGGFAFDKWDAVGAMHTAPTTSLLNRLAGRVLVMLSKRDELVPNEMGEALFRAASDRGDPEPEAQTVDSKGASAGSELRRLVVIDRALHENAWQERRWRAVIRDYITEIRKLGHARTKV